MARPPLGPVAMDHTVKFRLRADEMILLERISGPDSISTTLRGLIHDEYKRQTKGIK
jgi:hypothetical protein